MNPEDTLLDSFSAGAFSRELMQELATWEFDTAEPKAMNTAALMAEMRVGFQVQRPTDLFGNKIPYVPTDAEIAAAREEAASWLSDI